MKKNALILLNMGGPNNLDEVELFLTNMFNDPNILTMKSALLRKFVATMITFFRTESSQEIYRELGGKSPIVELTQKVVDALQKKLGDSVVVDFAMRYTPPFADDVCRRLESEEIERIYLLPMYPQYSSTTTKSSLEDFERAYHASDLDALLIEVKHYFENRSYNEAVIARIAEQLGDDDASDFDLIFSAHGLPQKIVDGGDPYQRHVERQVELLKTMLADAGMHFKAVRLAYQSKVGPMQWLEPALDDLLRSQPNKNVLIYPIAFTVDNSETDFELGIEYREIADEMGYENYRVCRCVNDHERFIDALAELYAKMIV
jgi:protoporphyrin/coproporphyrin ferrochelatase